MTTTEPETHLLRIEYLPLEDIPEADRNAKEHDKPRIAGSISRFGFADAPIIDERTGKLVAGHGRRRDLLARQQAGKEPPQGIVVDEQTGRWLMPVQRGWASRSDDDAKAFNITHNHLTETGGWNDRMLAELLQELGDVDPDLLEVTGYDEDDVAAMVDDFTSDHAETTGQLIDLMDVTVAEPTAQPKRGQVWTLGRHTLVVAKVMDEHHLWRHLLEDDTKLCAYPDPYLTHSMLARDNVCLFVHSSTYLAGHMVDKFVAAFPHEEVTRDGEAYTPGGSA